jgi:hypothetical protein
MDESRILRQRQADALADLDRRGDAPEDGSAAVLAVTTTVDTYPTSAVRFYACHPVAIDGGEDEGATPAFSVDTSRIFHACNLGTKVPSVGTYVLCHGTGGRWTFRYDG